MGKVGGGEFVSVILRYNYHFLIFFLLVPFGSKVVSFFTGMNQCVTQCQVKWGEQHQQDPPAPLQEVRSSRRKAQGSLWAWQAQGKKPVF